MSFRKSTRKVSPIFVLGICLIVIGFPFYSSRKTEEVKVVLTPTPQGSATLRVVERVFDGDTIEIEGGQKVRYIGIDAAEIYPKRLCFSDEALTKNKELVSGKVVRLEKDVSETDKYGRLLRYVYVGDLFVNNELTKGGYTKVMTVPPDVKYKDLFLESEKYAKENNLGFWKECVNKN